MTSFPIIPGERYRVIRTAIGDFIMGPIRLSAEPVTEEDGSKSVRIRAKMKVGMVRKAEEGSG